MVDRVVAVLLELVEQLFTTVQLLVFLALRHAGEGLQQIARQVMFTLCLDLIDEFDALNRILSSADLRGPRRRVSGNMLAKSVLLLDIDDVEVLLSARHFRAADKRHGGAVELQGKLVSVEGRV